MCVHRYLRTLRRKCSRDCRPWPLDRWECSRVPRYSSSPPSTHSHTCTCAPTGWHCCRCATAILLPCLPQRVWAPEELHLTRVHCSPAGQDCVWQEYASEGQETTTQSGEESNQSTLLSYISCSLPILHNQWLPYCKHKWGLRMMLDWNQMWLLIIISTM